MRLMRDDGKLQEELERGILVFLMERRGNVIISHGKEVFSSPQVSLMAL